MERSASPSKLLFVFLLQLLLLYELLEARILGDAYEYKRLLASGADGDDAVLLMPSSHLNLPDVSGNRPPKYTPPSPVRPPSPHHLRHGDSAQEQQRSPPASPPTGPVITAANRLKLQDTHRAVWGK